MDSQMEQADALLSEISQHPDLLPARYNWKGERRPYSRDELISLYEKIDADHLPHLLSKLIVHADAQIPPLVPGIRSLLSTGGSSLLREKDETERLRTNQDNVGGRTLQKDVFGRRSALKDKHALAYLRAKEIKGAAIRGSKIPPFVPSLFQELVIMNGHRFPTFCLLFDRTNNRIITGSDDYLIKIWSAQSGYLLFTLRGHSAVVTYMDLSTDNTMLASASDDGIVRVWDLRTSAPVAVLPTGASARGRKPISTVTFSPSPIPQIRYLIATSLDGYTWVWKYDRDTKKFTTPPTRLDCKTFNDSKLKCATWNCTGSQFAVAGTDLFIRVFSTIQKGPEAIKAGKRRKSYDKSKVEAAASTGEGSGAATNGTTAGTHSSSAAHQDWGDPVLIAQLDGHDGVVTSLSYSRRGNRILSGSVDGFVRIWKYDNQSKMWTSMAIDVRDENMQADATIIAAKPMMPSPVAITAPSNPFSNTNASNSLNDDANNTDSEMNGSTTASQTHANENTADENGQASGEDSRIVPTMAIWSLDDSAVILTTSLGEIKIFDSVTGEWMHTLKGHAPRSSIYVVDVHPQDSRILMTAGYDGQVILWDISKGIKLKSWMYAEQEFLDGRFSPDGLMFAVTDQEGKCILFGAGKNLDDFQDARSFVEQTFWSDYAPVRYDADHNVVDDTTQIAPHLMERTPILDTNGRDYARQKGPRYGLDLPLGLPPGALEQEEALKRELLEQELENLTEQALTIIPTTDKRKLYKRRRDFILEDDDDDDDPMTTEVPIVPLPNESSGEEYGGGVVSEPSSSSESEGDGDDSDLAPEDGADPVSNFVANDDDDDDDYFAAGQGSRKRRALGSIGTPRKQRITNDRKRKMRPRKRLRLRESDEEEEAMEEDFDEESDFDDLPMSPTRRGKRGQGLNSGPSGSKSQRSARPKSFANDDYPSDEVPESSGDEDEDVSVVSESSAGGSYSGSFGAHIVVPTPASPKKRKQWRGNGRKKGKAVVRDDKAMEFQKWLPSDWIKTNEPRKTPYHPQIGDYVAYLRQGHAMYLNETPLRPKLDLKIVPYLKDPSLQWVIFGRVSRITYNVGPPTWCTITLEEQIMSSSWGFPPNPEFSPSRRRFEIEFHDLGDVPDFIVLYSVFQEGVNAQYNVGEQVWASFDGNNYPGTISDQVVDDPSLPDSLWMAFEISWPNNEDVTNLSPWEIQREEQEDGPQGREEIPTEDFERIEEILNHFLGMEDMQIFKESVDFESYPDYCKAIAYPICLDAIQERITSGYYRRTRAVQFDIELLEKNALTYNDPRSGIAVVAKQLARIFKACLANPSKALPSQIKVKSSRRDEDDEFDGSGSENELVDIESEPEPDLDEEDLEDEDDQDADNAFLDDADESEEEGRTRSRSRTSSRRSTRAAAPTRKAKPAAAAPTSNGRRSRQSSGRAATTTSGTSKSGRGRKSKSRKKVDDDDDDDDDDGEWGKPTSRRGRGGVSTRRNGAKLDEEDEEEEYEDASAQLDDEDDDDLDDFKQDSYQSPASSTRPSRTKRKKAQIAESDDDYVS
ncbi:Bromodomain and WD repeat-containing protein 3 [Linnemannia elongata]|nr:Bromodomain and WD repeat-containing protein 3 [Linnemannia elongata]